MHEKMELRSAVFSANDDTGELFVSGIVNKTETWSGIIGKRKRFREKVKKGVFSEALKNAKRVDFLAEHDRNQLLSSTENGSLKLWEDEDGLKMEARIAPTSYGKDTYALIKSNLKNYMSFGFKVLKDSWDIGSDGIYERTIEKIVCDIGKRANINQKLTPHILRHTFASLTLQRGAKLQTIQKLLGHESITTTQIYAKDSVDNIIHDYNSNITF